MVIDVDGDQISLPYNIELGSSLTADIQVNETYSYQNKRVTHTLAIKAIDSQGLDGMTLSQWEEMHPR